MKKETITWTCDFCGKREINDVYPYEKKWAYLYKINFKLTKDVINNQDDKHFCSLLCMKTYIFNLIDQTVGEKK